MVVKKVEIGKEALITVVVAIEEMTGAAVEIVAATGEVVVAVTRVVVTVADRAVEEGNKLQQ